MLMRKVGRTDLDVSVLCLGGNVFGWTIDEPTSFAVLDAFMAGGGNFIDTADVYSAWAPGNSGGESEVVLGRWIAARKNRDKIILATKVGNRMANDPKKEGLARSYIIQAVEDSLRRLQTDYIDLYQSHRDDEHTPQEETLDTFNDLIKQGKVRALGASNYTAQRLAEALHISAQKGYARYECLQPPYHLANRATYEQDLEPLCREQEIGVISYSSLASGFLTGKYRAGKELPGSPRAQGIQRNYMNERGFAILEEVEKVARQHNATSGQVALAWIMARPGITAPIASATSVEQTHELLQAAELALTDEDIAGLNKISAWK
ncbi:MAG: aldo/keto reductase [Ktedonobacteraceae bacterium]